MWEIKKVENEKRKTNARKKKLRRKKQSTIEKRTTRKEKKNAIECKTKTSVQKQKCYHIRKKQNKNKINKIK